MIKRDKNKSQTTVVLEWCGTKGNEMTDRQKRIEELRKKAILDRVKREAYEVTPQIYAAFAIVLDKWEFGAPDIAEIFAETQEIWEKYADDPQTMCERALEITGIDVRTGGRS